MSEITSVQLLKDKIQKYVDDNYKGTLRFIKGGVLDKIDINCIDDMKRCVPDERLHMPLSLLTYCFLNDITNHPTCKICNGDVKFNTNRKEFANYCGNKCRLLDIDSVQDKKRETNIKRYGTSNVLTSEYGKSRTKETLMEKYGVTSHMKLATYKAKYSKAAKAKKYSDILTWPHVKPLFKEDEYHGATYDQKYLWLCNRCNTQFRCDIALARKPVCKNCAPRESKYEKIIREFLLKYNIDHIINSRSVLRYDDNGKSRYLEVDFVLPDHKICIEVNGLYIHGNNNKAKEYHQFKTDKCEQVGYKLIHLYSPWFYKKRERDIMFSMLKCRLGILQEKISARKCEIRVVSYNEAREFVDENHIQGGNVLGEYRYGLYYNNTLVQYMGFDVCGKRSAKVYDKPGFYKLQRLCGSRNCIIIGGASRLIKYAIRDQKMTGIITYADRSWSTGNVYKQLGFTHKYNTQPGYKYFVNDNNWYSREQFTIKRLRKRYPNYPDSMNEYDIMRDLGYERIYDSGHMFFEWIQKEEPLS